MVLRYNDFVADIEGTIEKLYAWMNLPISEGFHEIIDQVVQSNHAYESDNVYKLEDLGLTRQMIADEFHEVFEIFQFNRQADIASVMQ